jgi:hypothetical protein
MATKRVKQIAVNHDDDEEYYDNEQEPYEEDNYGKYTLPPSLIPIHSRDRHRR